MSEEKGPVVVQSVGDPHHLSAGVQTDGRLCGQQQFALKQQLVLLVRGEGREGEVVREREVVRGEEGGRGEGREGGRGSEREK